MVVRGVPNGLKQACVVTHFGYDPWNHLEWSRWGGMDVHLTHPVGMYDTLSEGCMALRDRIAGSQKSEHIKQNVLRSSLDLYHSQNTNHQPQDLSPSTNITFDDSRKIRYAS